jgi:hypothetical protein
MSHAWRRRVGGCTHTLFLPMNKYYVYGVSKTNSFAVVVMILAAIKLISCVHDCQCTLAHAYRHAWWTDVSITEATIPPSPSFLGWGWTEFSITEAATGLLYQPQMMIRWWWAWSDRWNAWQGNWSTQRKPAPMPLCAPQIPHDLTWAWSGPLQWEDGD